MHCAEATTFKFYYRRVKYLPRQANDVSLQIRIKKANIRSTVYERRKEKVQHISNKTQKHRIERSTIKKKKKLLNKQKVKLT